MLVMNTFPAQGMTTTYDLSSIITDSASAGTAMATGNKTISGTINMDPKFTEKYTTITETAKKSGWKIGIVSNVSLDHATPAAFYAHSATRKDYYHIGLQMSRSGFDYFAGGGLLEDSKGGFIPATTYFQDRGYKLVSTVEDFNKLTPADGKVYFTNPVLQDEKSMQYAMDSDGSVVTLAQMTSKGIELLNNDTGFFMMVEGGKIDWSCHANDAAASIVDTLALDEAISSAVDFYKQHPDETLIIVTGDHETGGLTIGFAGTGYSNYINRLQNQDDSYVAFNQKLNEFKKANPKATFDKVVPLIEDGFGLDVLTDKEYKTLADAVAKGKAKGATDADKAAGKDASIKLELATTPSERLVLENAFKATMMPSTDRAKITDVSLLYGGYEPLTVKLTTLINQKAGLAWTSYSHTGIPVQTSAIGDGAEQFNGFYENTDIYTKMMEFTGLVK
jgi:alkaline phosphatase